LKGVTIPRKGVKRMEKRKEYAEGDIMDCPRCGGVDVDYEEAPDHAKCNTCGLEFTIRTVAIWEE
jgi:transcription elongation factor Elf1